MKSEKVLAARIDAAKRAIAALGDMRPGHLSVQQRASGRNRRGYAQLSYTFQKRSRTDYVQPEDLEKGLTKKMISYGLKAKISSFFILKNCSYRERHP